MTSNSPNFLRCSAISFFTMSSDASDYGGLSRESVV
jgi:hypothetical protein